MKKIKPVSLLIAPLLEEKKRRETKRVAYSPTAELPTATVLEAVVFLLLFSENFQNNPCVFHSNVLLLKKIIQGAIAMKPKIGITCHYGAETTLGERDSVENIGQDWNFIGGDAIYAIEKAGGIPVLLPIYHNLDTLKSMVDFLDGVLLSGGHDLTPSLYRQQVKTYCGSIIPLRDNREFTLASYLLEEVPKPVLGIGRGMQLLNVVKGGTLYQDLSQDAGYFHHKSFQQPPNCPSHSVTLDPHSKLASIYGSYQIEVNSFHHQGICIPGRQIEVTAHSPEGSAEGIEIQGHPFAIGVQWHPEMMFDSRIQEKLLTAFVSACSPYSL